MPTIINPNTLPNPLAICDAQGNVLSMSEAAKLNVGDTVYVRVFGTLKTATVRSTTPLSVSG